jgi:hypothetical protein
MTMRLRNSVLRVLLGLSLAAAWAAPSYGKQ